MAYTDFKVDELMERFQLIVAATSLFGDIAPLEPSQWLLESLKQSHSMPLMNEKSRDEAIVAPVLIGVREYVGEEYAVFSGVPLEAGSDQGLTGDCDFLLSRTFPVPFLQAPSMVMTQAKEGDIERSLPRCIAQLLGVQRFNERLKYAAPRIHGCVTNGGNWQFLRLEGQDLWVDRDRYHLHDLGKILGILVTIMKGSDHS